MADTKPTSEQIQAVIDHFTEIAPKIRQFSAFGDSNRERIDFQIRVLKEHEDFVSYEDLAEDFDISYDDDYELFCSGEYAWQYANGEYDAQDGGGPFIENWDCLIDEPSDAALSKATGEGE